jgi:disulfide bond formation protein DsbB
MLNKELILLVIRYVFWIVLCSSVGAIIGSKSISSDNPVLSFALLGAALGIFLAKKFTSKHK